jgi:hypothetical protein
MMLDGARAQRAQDRDVGMLVVTTITSVETRLKRPPR